MQPDARWAEGKPPIRGPTFFPISLLVPLNLAEVRLPKSEVQAGRYRVFAALLREGALRGTQIDPDDILALDVREVLVSP